MEQIGKQDWCEKFLHSHTSMNLSSTIQELAHSTLVCNDIPQKNDFIWLKSSKIVFLDTMFSKYLPSVFIEIMYSALSIKIWN